MHTSLKFRRGEQVPALLRIANICTLFRSTHGHDYAGVPDDVFARNVYPLDSPAFRAWLTHRFQTEYESPPTTYAVKTAIQHLHATLRFETITESAVGRRVLPARDGILLDLAGEHAACVRITAQGWEPQDGFTVAFERSPETGRLPMPHTATATPAHESLEQLRALLNIPAGVPWTRVLEWLICALRPEGPYPILVVRGPSGAGKSTTARVLRSLLDPARTPLEALPNTPHRLEQAASKTRILAFDDVERIPRALISPLAKIADERAPVLLVLSPNSKSDLPEAIARRSLVLELAQPEALRTLHGLHAEFDRLRAAILGALCTAGSTALRRWDEFAACSYPRLADATAWTLAAAPALDLTEAAIREAATLPYTEIYALVESAAAD